MSRAAGVTKQILIADLNYVVKRASGRPGRAIIDDAYRFSTDSFWAYQKRAFLDVYRHARETVPYYRDRPDQYPTLVDDGGSVLDLLGRLPLVSKQILREHQAEFVSTKVGRRRSFHTTSGTTGTPIRLAATAYERGMALRIRESWVARQMGALPKPRVIIAGFVVQKSEDDPLCWYDPLTKNSAISIYAMKAENAAHVGQVFERFRPRFIEGYASAINELALRFPDVLREGREERIAVSTSEVLYPEWRETIRANLAETVIDDYGSQEGCHRVYECRHQTRHIHPLVGVVEILDSANRRVAAGEMGRCVVTGLLRKEMPLIRYDLGDTVVSTDYSVGCDCGLAWPTLGSVFGRSEDLVKTRDGRRVGYLAFHSSKNVPEIIEMQLVQKDYERFVCHLVLRPDTPNAREVEKKIKDEIDRRLGYQTDMRFEYVERIPRGANDKFKAVVVEF